VKVESGEKAWGGWLFEPAPAPFLLDFALAVVFASDGRKAIVPKEGEGKLDWKSSFYMALKKLSLRL